MIELYQNITLEMGRWGLNSTGTNALLGWTAVHKEYLGMGMTIENVLGLSHRHHIDYNIRGKNNNTILYFMDFNKKPPPEINPAGAEKKERRD